ncbi:MAG TPA: glycosyltransferase, partial [Vicinamibacterales bacterium]
MTRPLRVAVVARSVFPLHGLGGLERSVYDLVRHLASGGIDVTLITRTPAQPVAPDAIDPRITTVFVPYKTFPLAGRRGTTVIDRSTAYPLFGERAGKVAFDLVERGAIDVVHGFGASVLGYARRRASAAAPLVLNPQGLEEFGATDPSRARLKRAAYLPLRKAVRACARAADAVIATDRALEPAVLNHLGIAPERMRTIPNALDLATVDGLATASDGARVRLASGIAPDDVVLLSVSRIEENKGFHVLLHALAALRTHGALEEPWRWVALGEGPYRSALETLASKLGVSDHV